jgi:RND family efflux transporter MFP subunit
LTLSAAEAAAQVKNVEAQESQARIECERYEALKAKGAVTDLEYQQKLTQCQTLPLTREAASARARLAAQNVGDGVIRAPFAGVVTERHVEVGQYLRQDSRVVSLAAVDPIRLELAVPEAEVANVKAEAKVSFTVAAYPKREFEGTIRFVSGAVRPTTRDLLVEAVVANQDKLLRPGMFAEARLALGTRNVPSVPKAAVLQRDETARAFFAVDGRAQERILALGPEAAGRIAVERGAKIGDLVILGDLSVLSNGQPIQPQ